MPESVASSRVKWVDAAKFIGIFMVSFYHFIDPGGKLYYFAGEFHMPLFFFLSGFFMKANAETRFITHLKQKVKTLLIPYLAFCVLTVAVLTVYTNNFKGTLEILVAFRHILLCKDYHPDLTPCLYVGARWFIICLFFISVIYYFIKKYIPSKWARVVFCLAIYLALENLCPWDVWHFPQLPLGIDRVLYFMFYFCLGDALFAPLCKLLGMPNHKKKHVLNFSLLAIGTLAAYIVFSSGSIAAVIGQNISSLPVVSSLIVIAVRLVLILWVVIFSQYLQTDFAVRAGQNTLYLCGLEQIVRLALSSVLAFLPITLTFNPFVTVLLALALLWLTNDFVVTPLRRHLATIRSAA